MEKAEKTHQSLTVNIVVILGTNKKHVFIRRDTVVTYVLGSDVLERNRQRMGVSPLKVSCSRLQSAHQRGTHNESLQAVHISDYHCLPRRRSDFYAPTHVWFHALSLSKRKMLGKGRRNSSSTLCKALS